MARTDEQTRKLFDEWARTYDGDLLQADGPLFGYAHSVETIDTVVQVEQNAHVLDIGIGSGALAKRLADRGAQITGIDVSEKMLEVCAQQHPSFELHLGSFNGIPVSDERFDCVVSGFAFHETQVARRSEACVEMARVLKPDGFLCLLDIMFASQAAMQEARQLIAEKWDDDEDYAIVGDLDALLRQNGFTALKWYQTGPFHWMVTARKCQR